MSSVSSHTKIHGFIRENSFTCRLPPRLINLLAAKAEPRTFSNGEYLFRRNDSARHIYFVMSGHVWLQGKDHVGTVRVWNFGEGSLIGWSSLTKPFTYLLDARAAENVEVLAVNVQTLRELLEQDHELGYHVFQLLLKAAAQRFAPYCTDAPNDSEFGLLPVERPI